MAVEQSLSYKTGGIITETQAILERYEIWLQSNYYESLGAEEFGSNLGRYIDETMTSGALVLLKSDLIRLTESNFPQVKIIKLEAKPKPQAKTVILNMLLAVIPTGSKENLSIEVGN